VTFEPADPVPAEEPVPQHPPLRSRNTLLRDVVEIVLLVVTIYTLVNLATSRAVVEGASMKPNFATGQLVIINRFAYYFNSPARGDVIVLHNPRQDQEDFIKRVVGLPGETIQIKEGRVYANGTLLDEPYVEEFCTAGCDGTWTLDNDHYFVLGDNRNHSYDSHSFGPIQRSLIVGQAWIRYWPLSDFEIINHPGYGQISKERPPLPTPTPTIAPKPDKSSPNM